MAKTAVALEIGQYRRQEGITKEDIIRVHKAHPEWPVPRVADALGIDGSFVRAMKQRHAIDIPSWDYNAYEIGVLVKRLGITKAMLLSAAGLTKQQLIDFIMSRRKPSGGNDA
jgi:hypothetical protein